MGQDVMSEIIEGVIIGVISLCLICTIMILRCCGCIKGEDDETVEIIEETIIEGGPEPVTETKETVYPPGYHAGMAPPSGPPV